jgi:3-oxoadipate enol-lactonase
VHAGVGDRRLWDDQRDVFAARYRVVRYDLRGYGDSPLPPGPFSFVRDLCALFDHLGIERGAVVGNSFGGRVALEFALAHPGRVGALVLAAAALGGVEHSPELERFGAEEDELLEAGKVGEAVELNLRTWLGGVAPDVRERVRAMQRRAFEVLLAAYEHEPHPGPVEWVEPPATERLGEISAPTLVLVGAEDLPDFRAIAERLAAEIPGAERAVIEGARHLPGVERPEELNRLVLEFLARL